jgi:hypothetical protein
VELQLWQDQQGGVCVGRAVPTRVGAPCLVEATPLDVLAQRRPFGTPPSGASSRRPVVCGDAQGARPRASPTSPATGRPVVVGSDRRERGSVGCPWALVADSTTPARLIE